MAHFLPYPRLLRRSPVLGVILLMHAGAVIVLSGGLAPPLPKADPVIQVLDLLPRFIEPTPPPPEPVEQVAARPDRAPPRDIPPPELIAVTPLVDEPPMAGEMVSVPDAAPRAADVITDPGLDPRHPLNKPNYPAQAIRLNQEGVVRVSACVQPDGRLARVALGRSSGFPALDAAAVKHLSKTGVRLRPGTRNGEPVETCTEIPIRFDIENR